MDYTFWTDSAITVTWIKSVLAKWRPSVANRFREIQEKTDSSKWRNCPGKDNPADRLTRAGVSIKKLTSSKHGGTDQHGYRIKICGRSKLSNVLMNANPWKQNWYWASSHELPNLQQYIEPLLDITR